MLYFKNKSKCRQISVIFFPSVNPTCYLKYQQKMSTEISIKTIKHLTYILRHSQKLIQTVFCVLFC